MKKKNKKNNLVESKKKKQDELATAKELEGLSMLEAVEHIVVLAERSKLDERFFQKAEPFCKIVAEKQGINEIQAVLLSLLLERSTSSRRSSILDIARMVNCRAITFLKYDKELSELVKRHFIRMRVDSDGDKSYYVPHDVVDAFAQSKKFERKPYKCEDEMDFFQKYYELTHLKYYNELTYSLFYHELGLLFGDNQNLKFVQELKKLKLPFAEEIILTHFCRHLILNNNEALETENLDFLIEDEHTRRRIVRELKKGTYVLMKRKLIEYNFEDGFEDKDAFRLTAKTINKLLKGYDVKLSTKTSRAFIFSKTIEEKKLFYDGKTISQIDELAGLLEESNFKSIRLRLKEQKMRCGFACIFYGAPGTGKTETVMQLARRTGRNIMQVNISEVKSMWVGESEKNIQAIFDRYREYAKNAKVTPILLFNEADAIIGKRCEGAERAIDKMENSIQNIILQEMEKLDGIMIATTNLEQNMDKAFERRFLYKIKFNKPSVETRSNIWRCMIPELTNDESDALACRYDFSGGQIENITRHFAIDNVLHGERKHRLECLYAYCDEELFEKKEQRKIGFV